MNASAWIALGAAGFGLFINICVVIYGYGRLNGRVDDVDRRLIAIENTKISEKMGGIQATLEALKTSVETLSTRFNSFMDSRHN